MHFKPPKLRDYEGDISKRWCVFWFVEKKIQEGKSKWVRKVQWISTKMDRVQRYQEAKKISDFVIDRLKNGLPIEDEFSTLSLFEALDRTYLTKEAYTSARSASNMKIHINNLKAWLKKNDLDFMNAEAFTHLHAMKYIEDVFLKKKKKLAPRTLNGYLSYYKLIFSHICILIDKDKNPFSRVTRFKVKEADIKVWNEDLRKILLDYLKINEPEIYLVTLFVFHCFMRPNEIRQIQIGDLDLNNQIVNVPAIKNKSNKSKNPTLSPEIIGLLIPIIDRYPKNYYLFSERYKPGKKILGRGTISTKFRKIRKKLNLPDIMKLYSFKHTGNSIMLENGATIQDLRQQNGHSETRTTEIYAKRISKKANPFLQSKFDLLK